MTTPTLPQRLRAMADHTGPDAVAELLREAAEQLERQTASRKAAQIENEELKARIARSGVEQQRAVLAERRNKWQPMETAPKDGSMFLCWVSAVRYGETDDGQQYQQDASQPDFCAWRGASQDDGYWDAFCGQIGDVQDITHWMQIPPTPQQEGEQT